MKKNKFRRFFILVLMLAWFFAGWPAVWKNPRLPPKIQEVYAAVTVTAATGGTAISADNYGTGTYTTLTGPTISEGANREISAGNKTIILNAPTDFNFNTGQNVTATISLVSGSGTCFAFSSATATPTATTITFTVSGIDSKGSQYCKAVFSNIQVRPTAGTPLASGNITNTGNNTSIPSGSTNFGTLTEVVGAKSKLAVTAYSSTATVNTDFATKPVVTLQDRYANTVTTDSFSTITEAVVLSTQSCGGTAGSGSLTSLPTSGTAVTSGVMTYTAMQYSAIESIKICFTSVGVTSVLGNAVNVIGLPTVTTQAASSVKDTTATGNGNITATGGENNDKRGFVYDTTSRSLPGNVAPTSSGYASYAEDSAGNYGAGTFTKGLINLSIGTTYYTRAYSHNSVGYSYGNEVNFTTAILAISITSDGEISYGFVDLGDSKDTVGSDTQTARNDSTIAENFNIRTSNALGGTQWTIGSSPGTNVFVHEFSTNGGGLWTKFDDAVNYQTLAESVGVGNTINFDLRVTLPTDSDTEQKTITVTVQAVAQP